MTTFNKNIWIFWEQGWDNAPLITKLCRDSWIKYNKNTWNIRILDKNNLHEYINVIEINKNFWNIKPIQIRADIIRVLLIKKFGGVWVDATTICIKPLDKWLFDYFKVGDFEDFFIFIYESIFGFSNYFIAGHSENYIIKTFSDRFLSYFKTNLVAKKYFQFYDDFKYLLKTDSKFRDLFYLYQKYPSEKTKLIENFEYDKSDLDILRIVKENDSPIYKLSHKINFKLIQGSNIYNLFKYIGLDIFNYINIKDKPKLKNKIQNIKQQNKKSIKSVKKK